LVRFFKLIFPVWCTLEGWEEAYVFVALDQVIVNQLSLVLAIRPLEYFNKVEGEGVHFDGFLLERLDNEIYGDNAVCLREELRDYSK
jgi:hypothetical protein